MHAGSLGGYLTGNRRSLAGMCPCAISGLDGEGKGVRGKLCVSSSIKEGVMIENVDADVL